MGGIDELDLPDMALRNLSLRFILTFEDSILSRREYWIVKRSYDSIEAGVGYLWCASVFLNNVD